MACWCILGLFIHLFDIIECDNATANCVMKQTLLVNRQKLGLHTMWYICMYMHLIVTSRGRQWRFQPPKNWLFVFNKLFKLTWLTTNEIKDLCITALCEGNPPVIGRYPHKGLGMRKTSSRHIGTIYFVYNYSNIYTFFPLLLSGSVYCCPVIIISHNSDVIMSAMTSQITGVSVVCSNVCSGADQRKHQCSASLAFVTGGFRSQRASNAEKVSISWRHHDSFAHRCINIYS